MAAAKLNAGERYVLRSDNLEVTVLERGATIFSIRFRDSDGQFHEVTNGFADPDDYFAPGIWFGANCGRVANRIEDFRFTLDGTEYALPENDGDNHNHLHGGPEGFNRRMFAITQDSETSLTAKMISPDGDQGYPGEVTLTIHMFIKDGTTLRIEYEATTTAPTPIALTNHTFFALQDEGTIVDQSIKVNAVSYLPVKENMVPTGEIRPVIRTPFDLRVPERIGESLLANDIQIDTAKGIDHMFILDRGELDADKNIAAEVHDKDTGIVLTLRTDQPGVQVYTDNYPVDGLDKQGRPFEQYGSICLEAQTYPNAINTEEFPSPVLRPGEVYSRYIEYTFSNREL